jgi:Cof subfamily protein (haloacid dehalogenase superfamily)
MPRLIALDIDGTLMPSSGTLMSARTRSALLAVEAAGIEIVIATGRRQAYAIPLLDQVGLRADTVLISSNGTVTRTFAGEPIDRHFLPVATARALCPALRPFGGTTVFTFDKLGRGELVLESIDRLHARVEKWVEANRPWIEEISPLERAFDGDEAPIQAMMCGTVAEMKAAEAFLEASEFEGLVELHRTEYAERDLSILDILPLGCSKGIALARLSERRGIAQPEVMAIGDNWNDLEMLRWAGQPVLMGNASAELVEIAEAEGWQMTATNDEDGVALVLEALLRHVPSEPALAVQEVL